MIRWLAALWLAALGLCALAADGFVPVPRLEARVTDLTGTLTRDQQTQLENQLAGLERDKGAQIALLLLPTTQPESIEAFGIRLAEAWKIGRKGADDGVILIVAKNDRAVRIEVGYGLEGVIPDAVAKRIIEERVTPRFREGDFFGGLQGAVAVLGKIIGGEPLPAPTQRAAAQGGDDTPALLVFIVIMLANVARKVLGLLGSLLAAGVAGWLAFAVFGSWLAAVVAALAAFVMSFSRFGGGGPGWQTGGGGFPGGSGGYSGGGGGFGGGGASGRW